MNLKKFLLFFICISLTASSLANEITNDWHQEIQWDWNAIALDDATLWQTLTIPKNFLWGVATFAFQIEGIETAHGHCSNSWTMRDQLAQPGTSVEHWKRYKEDVQLIKNLDITTAIFIVKMIKNERLYNAKS